MPAEATFNLFFRSPPSFLSEARFSVLAIAIAASFSVYFSENNLKTNSILNVLSGDGFPYPQPHLWEGLKAFTKRHSFMKGRILWLKGNKG